MITLIEKTIEKVEFELVINTKHPKRSIGGLPCLFINGEPHVIYDVDLADIIRTLATSNNLSYVKKGVADHWCEGTITETITKLEKGHDYL